MLPSAANLLNNSLKGSKIPSAKFNKGHLVELHDVDERLNYGLGTIIERAAWRGFTGEALYMYIVYWGKLNKKSDFSEPMLRQARSK